MAGISSCCCLVWRIATDFTDPALLSWHYQVQQQSCCRNSYNGSSSSRWMCHGNVLCLHAIALLMLAEQDKRNKKKKLDPASAASAAGAAAGSNAEQQQQQELFVGLFKDAAARE